jgi:hypothetical protein
MIASLSLNRRIAAPLLVALATLTGCASPSQASTLADLRVVNRATGQIASTYHHNGRTYVSGNPGDRFAVQIVNRSARRVLAVASVDGVNAVSGETANPHQGGYVLSPGQSYDILGWRKNVNEVSAFYFTTLGDSYAARTDRPANVGVIGLAVFREFMPPRPRPMPQIAPSAPAAGASSRDSESRAESSAQAMRSAPQAAQAPAERIGTGHGERVRSDVSVVDFRRASSQPDEVITIYYDTHANLVARGIIPSAPIYGEPRPFPGMRFAPDPRS